MRLGAIEGGGTKFVCAIGDEFGNIYKRVKFPTTTPIETLNHVIDFFLDNPVDFIGYGTFGPVDLKPSSQTYGCILNTPKKDWINFDVLNYLSERLDSKVYLDTDVNLACLGEVYFGDSKDLESVLYITIGTGIGVGAIIDGHIIHGVSHGEMGHILVRKNPLDDYSGKCMYHHDCLEGLASGPAIEERYGCKGETLSNNEEVWKLIGSYVGEACTNYTYMFNPERIILGGGVGQQPLLLKYTKENFIQTNKSYITNKFVQDIDSYITVVSLKDDAGCKGCLAFAYLKSKNLI